MNRFALLLMAAAGCTGDLGGAFEANEERPEVIVPPTPLDLTTVLDGEPVVQEEEGAEPLEEPVEAPVRGASEPDDRPAAWPPVTVPLGPREGTGVRWEGVKHRGGRPRDLGNGESYDDSKE